MTDFQATKKLKYEVKGYKVLKSVDDIKRALVAKNHSMPMVTELLWQEYYIPCEADEYLAQTT